MRESLKRMLGEVRDRVVVMVYALLAAVGTKRGVKFFAARYTRLPSERDLRLRHGTQSIR